MEYGQHDSERSFGLLKDPLFFTASVLLKTPQRIAALVVVMGLAVMVYTLGRIGVVALVSLVEPAFGGGFPAH